MRLPQPDHLQKGKYMRKRIACTAAVVAGFALLPASAAQASDFSYMETVAPGANLKVLLTSADTVGGVVWPGVPDGIGALKQGKDLVVFTNHELSATNPVAASTAHGTGGSTGATVSAINIDSETMTVKATRDLLNSVAWYDYTTGQYGSTPKGPVGSAAKDSYGTPNHSKAINRFCSAFLAEPGSLATRVKEGAKEVTYGFTGPAYFTGEEGSDESRAFVMSNTGSMVQLPKLGLAAWENLIVAPTTGRNTVIMENEDGSATDSQLWMYVGTKTNQGDWTERAGLNNGQLYVMSVDGQASDTAIRASAGKGTAMAVNFKPIDTTKPGVAQNADAKSLGTVLARVEDGAFDPKHPNDYYFVTTESNKDPKATTPNPETPKVSRDGGALWRLRFNDVNNPLSGANLTMLLDGSEAPYLSKPDNLDIDASGNILLQEDPGNNDHVARLVAYRIADGKVATVAKFKDAYFKPGSAQLMTVDEESSGVLDVTDLVRADDKDKKSYFLLDAQVHTSPTVARPDLAANPDSKAALTAAIEGGQLYLLTIDDWNKVYG